MKKYTYVTLRQKPELKEAAAAWFHDKWCLLIKQLSVTSNSYICSGHARIGTDAKEHKVFASES